MLDILSLSVIYPRVRSIYVSLLLPTYLTANNDKPRATPHFFAVSSSNSLSLSTSSACDHNASYPQPDYTTNLSPCHSCSCAPFNPPNSTHGSQFGSNMICNVFVNVAGVGKRECLDKSPRVYLDASTSTITRRSKEKRRQTMWY